MWVLSAGAIGIARRLLVFPGLDPDFVSSQVDIAPAQSCQIGQSLAGVEPEENQASPFFIGYFDYPPDLGNRERPASVVGNLAANRFHEFARVFDDVPVPLSRAENEFDGFKVMVGRGSARFLGNLVSKLGYHLPGHRRQIELSRWPQEFENLEHYGQKFRFKVTL
jgi:hypothetical protein